MSTFVTVRAGGINVLYLVGAKRIGGGPGAEQRFVRAALAHSPDIVVERRLINYEPMGVDISDVIGRQEAGDLRSAECGVGRPAHNGETRARSAPDVIILDDVDVQGLSAASWQAIAERVRKGMGLIMLGGYHSYGPGGFRESPLADVLPMNIGPAQRQEFGEPLREDVQLGAGEDAAGGAARSAASDDAAGGSRGRRSEVGGQGNCEWQRGDLGAVAAAGWGECGLGGMS